jgi:flagellar biosynthetic protein FliS
MLYRQTAVEGASGFGLLIALYDTLASDLHRAADAQRNKDIEMRAEHARHALVVVGFLENWVEADSGQLAQTLAAFYAKLRRNIIKAQAKQSPEILEDLMRETLSIREVWQRLDTDEAPKGPEILPPFQPQLYRGPFLPQVEQRHLNWSA